MRLHGTRTITIKDIFYNVIGEFELKFDADTSKNLGLPKDHHYDALCVGTIPVGGYKDRTNGYAYHAKAIGRGSRLRGKTNNCGVITVKWLDRSKRKFGFQPNDICVLDKPKGKNQGQYTGKVALRSSGYFDLYTPDGAIINAHNKYFKVLQHADGYEWSIRCAIPLGRGSLHVCPDGQTLWY